MQKTFFLLFWAFPLVLQAQFSLRSGLFNPPGSPDNGYEYIEIKGPPVVWLSGLWLLEIDGDGTAAGDLDRAIPLSSYTTGNNGLLLLRDASNPIQPIPTSSTNVQVYDFSPDLENGTVTFALVQGFSGTPGSDLDPDNDGILDSQPWTAVLDAIALSDGNAGDRQYAGAMGFPTQDFPEINGPINDNAKGWAKFSNVLYAFDLDAGSPAGGPYLVSSAWDQSGALNPYLAGTAILTPGNSSAPLPVSWYQFEANVLSSGVLLHWATATERDAAQFDIERSTNGWTYQIIGNVPASGNSNSLRVYEFLDPDPPPGNLYYRIRQTDFNHNFTTSRVVSIIFAHESSWQMYPLPAVEYLTVAWDEPFRMIPVGTLLTFPGKCTAAVRSIRIPI
ncbi:MAG: hypothetical protein IPL65_15210 [Lewinellaceae bacterium]|nr:hypothetical protein [Lewinellaceae bacterium]